MNQEQYNRIKEYRDILISAYEAQFVRGVELSQFNIIKMVYEEITKDIYNGLKINCSSCVIKLYSMIGEALINFENNIKHLEVIKIADNVVLDVINNDVKNLTNDLLYIEDTKINTSSKNNKTNKKNLS